MKTTPKKQALTPFTNRKLRAPIATASMVTILCAFPLQNQAHAVPYEEFSTPLAKDAEIKIKILSGHYFYETDGELNYLRPAKQIKRDDEPDVYFSDLNNDNLQDVIIKVAPNKNPELKSKAGRNLYAIYTTKIHNGKVTLIEYPDLFSNITFNKDGTFRSKLNYSPYPKTTTYRAEDGEIYRSESAQQITHDLKKVEHYRKGVHSKTSIKFQDSDIDGHACITSKKAYISLAPSFESRKKAYLIEGDRVRLLDISEDGSWLKIAYEESNTNGWVAIEDLRIEVSCS